MSQKFVMCNVDENQVVIDNIVFLPPKKVKRESGSKYLFVVFFSEEGIKSPIYGTYMKKGFFNNAPWEKWKAGGIRCDGGEK